VKENFLKDSGIEKAKWTIRVRGLIVTDWLVLTKRDYSKVYITLPTKTIFKLTFFFPKGYYLLIKGVCRGFLKEVLRIPRVHGSIIHHTEYLNQKKTSSKYKHTYMQ